LEKTQEEVARLQVEYERVQEKFDRAQREMRQACGDLEKYRVDNMSLQTEVERFAARMGKYQVNIFNLDKAGVTSGRFHITFYDRNFQENVISCVV